MKLNYLKERNKIMKLWGGRFTKEENTLVNQFNASISFDQRFYRQDIRGSIAHVTMLAKQGILTEEEKQQIITGLEGILSDVENGILEIDPAAEDIHSFVEAALITRIGDVGKKLHTSGFSCKRTPAGAFNCHRRKPGNLYAWLYSSPESSACHDCPPFQRLF